MRKNHFLTVSMHLSRAFRCGQNYTDGKNMLKKKKRKSKLVKYGECNKKHESRFAKYMFTKMKWWKRFCRHMTFPALFAWSHHFIPPPTVQIVSGFSYSTRVFFFFTSTRIFFCLDSNFKISNRVYSHDICLVFFRSWTYILQISTHVFYCIRCILQVSTYVLCFQHVFTIGIILSATERHICL